MRCMHAVWRKWIASASVCQTDRLKPVPHKRKRNGRTNGARRNRASFFDVNAENRLWHTLSPRDAAGALGVDRARGLDEAGVVARRARYGLNRLAEKPPRSRWLLLLDQFKSLLILVLVGAALLEIGRAHV